ncbi:TetR family transcriptional regulator [Plantactinospora sp. CA-290183]|uniref:TetR family transcriptional regulator n=1 Tax=Plantactinospora sp. CA-290183 TaxID=3240006 RepID=UPI003D8BED56
MRRALMRHALRLFLTQGYDATTVNQIAEAAGVSHMTFFRYFANKSAVFDMSVYDTALAEHVARRPKSEPPLTALHRATMLTFTEIDPTDLEMLRKCHRIILETPSAQAHLWQRQQETERHLVDALISRSARPEPELRPIVAAYLAITGTSLAAWVESDGQHDLPRLLDHAYNTLCAAGRSSRAGRPSPTTG